MAPPKRQVFLMLVSVTGFLYILYTAYTSGVSGKIASSPLNLKWKVRESYAPKGEEEEYTYVEEIPDNSTSDIPAPTTRSLYDAGFRFPNPELCPDFGSQLRLVIIVTSTPSHLEEREGIRLTWGHIQLRKDMALGFLLGRSNEENETLVREENAIYGDIILANFVDSYNNLTLKTTSALEWVDNYCNRAKMFLKTDDDIFLNVPRLLDFVTKHWKEERKIFGSLALNWHPIRLKSSKYYVSVNQYKFRVFPNFMTGGAYLITTDVIHDLYEGSLNMTYLKLEDVFTTGIVAQEKNVPRVDFMWFYSPVRVPMHSCNILKVICTHRIKPYEQFHLWRRVMDGRVKCISE